MNVKKKLYNFKKKSNLYVITTSCYVDYLKRKISNLLSQNDECLMNLEEYNNKDIKHLVYQFTTVAQNTKHQLTSNKLGFGKYFVLSMKLGFSYQLTNDNTILLLNKDENLSKEKINQMRNKNKSNIIYYLKR